MRRSHIIFTHVAMALLSVVTLSLIVATRVSAATRQVSEQARISSWDWCNTQSVKHAPAVLWIRLKAATKMHHDIPERFWGNPGWRADIVKIACYESTFQYHAENGPYYGLFQMSSSLVASEGVQFRRYWNGYHHIGALWYQCTAAERYIRSRYGNPATAWRHEMNYGWY